MALQASSSDDDDDDDISMSFTIDTSIVDLLPDMKLSADDLNLIFNHVVLPVQLPMQGDAQPSHVETLLLSFTIGALESYLALVDPDTRSQWAPLQRMLTGLYKSRNNLELNTSKLSAQLHQLEKNSFLAVYVRAQNAGLYLYQPDNATVNAEAFELSPTSDSVMTTRGRQVRTFPGRAVTLPASVLSDVQFRSELSRFLSSLNTEKIASCMPMSCKAGTNVVEVRDTTDPCLITELLMQTLYGLGGQNASMQPLRKNTRDDVCWEDTVLPWRRSPFWLFLRVILQRTLSHVFAPDTDLSQYKLFTAHMHACLLGKCLILGFSSDLTSQLSRKLARRIYKVNILRIDETSSEVATGLLERARESLEQEWEDVQRTERAPITFFSGEGSSSATHLKLNKSRKYLIAALNHQPQSSTSASFIPPERHRIALSANAVPSLSSVPAAAMSLALSDTSYWIKKYMRQLTASTHLSGLSRLLHDYWHEASKAFAMCPRSLSAAILDIYDIWAVMDRLCVNTHPMLAEYPPEAPSSVLSSLLVPEREELGRLHAIELYIMSRQQRANASFPGLWSPPQSASFAVRFFDTSPRHQALKQRIELEATQRRERKRMEWENLNRRYQELAQSYNSSLCKLLFDEDGEEIHDDTGCVKCQMRRTMSNMTIRIDEKSLPESEVQAKLAVFELEPPAEISLWRDATWHLVYEICGGQEHEKKSGWSDNHDQVAQYVNLRPYARAQAGNLTLVSHTKSYLRSHYNTYHFPVECDKILMPSALSFSYWDRHRQHFVSDMGYKTTIEQHTTFRIEDPVYKALQFAVDSSQSSANLVMAYQGRCHQNLGMQEFISYGSLRAGARLQLLNLLRELGAPNLNWSSHAVHILMLQTIWQAGPSDGAVLRQAHCPFGDCDSFSAKMLHLLDSLLDRIEVNWRESTTLLTVIMLALRTLSLSSGTHTDACCRLLIRARSIATTWCRQLRDTINTADLDQHSLESVRAYLLNAAVCIIHTYDCDEEHAQYLLPADQVPVFITAHLISHANAPTISDMTDCGAQQRAMRMDVIAHRLNKQLYDYITADAALLNVGVRALFKDIQLSDLWSKSPGSRAWLMNKTTTADEMPYIVHYNLLEGIILVNGRPVSTVPDVVRDDVSFRRLFHQIVPTSLPSHISGMYHMLTRTFSGWSIHVGWDQARLLIRACKDCTTLEVVPANIFAGDLPKSLAEDFIHFLNLSTGCIEFRPKSDMWHSSPQNPFLRFQQFGASQLHFSSKLLIDSHSFFGERLIDAFKPIESAEHIHLSLSENGLIEVHLFRHDLNFFVNVDGKLESRELDALIEPSQELGTFIGLRNKIILSHRSACRETAPLSVLVPVGIVHVQADGQHVKVSIESSADDCQRYIVFSVNRHLQRLQGPQDVFAHLYKAYLHATTSHILPDPLTGRSGTEEALSLLREQLIFGPGHLTLQSLDLLDQIAKLTGERHYYPQHKTCMQTVTFNRNIPMYQQHDEFLPATTAIRNHYGRTARLGGKSDLLRPAESHGSEFLLDRARRRNSVYGRSRDLDDSPSDGLDTIYNARDVGSTSQRAYRVFKTATLIKQWPPTFGADVSLVDLVTAFRTVHGYGSRFKPSSATIGNLLATNPANIWGSLYKWLLGLRKTSKYSLLFTLATMIFGAHDPSSNSILGMDSVVEALLAFAFDDRFLQCLPPEDHGSYIVSFGKAPDFDTIAETLESCTNAEYTSEKQRITHLTRKARKSPLQQLQRALDSDVRSATQQLISQWPSITVRQVGPSTRYLDSTQAIQACQTFFDKWHINRRFLDHIANVEVMLKTDTRLPSPIAMPSPVRPALATRTRPTLVPSLQQILQSQDPGPQHSSWELKISTSLTGKDKPNVVALSPHWTTIVSKFKNHADQRRQKYGVLLQESEEAFGKHSRDAVLTFDPFLPERYQDDCRNMNDALHVAFTVAHAALCPPDVGTRSLRIAGLWPLVNHRALLGQLSAANYSRLKSSWKRVLTRLGEALSNVLRCERVLTASRSGDLSTLQKELSTSGRCGWSAEDHPYWLLLEIENNITIRERQVKVAMELMTPALGANSVSQLNMGEGKSSVIIPMVAVALSDTKQLVRIIVLKPLLAQTQHLLTQRLGGLIDQQVCTIAFSRHTPLDAQFVHDMKTTYADCIKQRGVLVTLPEHILSFRLMGREKLSNNRELASQLIDTERWISRHCRDLLDESDQLLDPRFQLVYTVGAQQMLDGQPDRWLVIQAILDRIDASVESLNCCEVSRKGCGFPVMIFTDSDKFKLLKNRLVEDVLNGYMLMSFDYCTPALRAAVVEYMTVREPRKDSVKMITNEFKRRQHWKPLQLLRGLLALDVLQFTLTQKRWLVDYGNTDRCLMAVPYRAKGVPSLAAEFSHAEVAIVLTYTSYYYGGLSFEQVRQCFQILYRDPSPQGEYEEWCRASTTMPKEFTSWDAVNLEDTATCREKLFPSLVFNRQTINFFLRKVVFPKEGKEFPMQISTSSWDLPAVNSGKLSTGFSGTNDNRFLLPASVEQKDLPELVHTNAMVVNLLLQPENQTYFNACDSAGRKLDSAHLLEYILRQTPNTRVLIDVGAQFLDSNLTVARLWLSASTTADAALFFDAHDEPIVVDRRGSMQTLKTSHYRFQLRKVLIYLDEAHTRGIDIAVPSGTHAAVTLGPRLVKDRLVQACMRMRKLGDSHFLTFFAPPEVDISLRELCETPTQVCTSAHVIYWCMEQTCLMLEAAQPLRVMQGLQWLRRQQLFERHLPASLDVHTFVRDTAAVQQFWSELQENETGALDQLYGTTDRCSTLAGLLDRQSSDHHMKHLVSEFDLLRQGTAKDMMLDEEQEREVAHEVETESQIQRPPEVKAAKSAVSLQARDFVRYGSFTGMKRPAFLLYLATTAAAVMTQLRIQPDQFALYATPDYYQCVQLDPAAMLDQFLRPVNWILRSLSTNELLIISPHEANELLPKIRSSDKIRLHVYEPKTVKTMQSYAALDFYTPNALPHDILPSASGIRDLDLFAGALYVSSIEDFVSLCDFLGIVTQARQPKGNDIQIDSDGFAPIEKRVKLQWPPGCPFEMSPLKFLRAIFSLRSRAQEISHTHMGFLVDSRAVHADLFKENQIKEVGTDDAGADESVGDPMEVDDWGYFCSG